MQRKTLAVVCAIALGTAWAAGCGSSAESEFKDPDAGGGTSTSSTSGFTPTDGPVDPGDANVTPPVQDTCSRDGDGGTPCQYDTYCDPLTSKCVPFAPGASNSACSKISVPGNFAPKTKCEFPSAIPIPGDPFPDHVDVQTTPLVVRFGAQPTPPSIIAPFTVPPASRSRAHGERPPRRVPAWT